MNESSSPSHPIELDHPQALIALLEQNYRCLNRQYRMGGFEDKVSYVRRSPESAGKSFYELSTNVNQAVEGEILFRKAIEDFHQLILHIKKHDPDEALRQAVLILRCHNLIYEAYDYALQVPSGFEEYFLEIAQRFSEHPSPKYMERWAEELNAGVPFPQTGRLTQKEQRTRVIKDLIMATLCAANFYFRQHHEITYETALTLLERIYKYVVTELPSQHEVQRQSFGLLGLALYLKGRVLMAQGSYAKSRVAFRQSAEAYVDRLRQKEAVLRTDLVTEDELKEKVSVTVRRVALVTAFGDGYLSYLNGQIDRALQALTLARATLTQNSGKTYLTYVDVWYWACERAKHSSDKNAIDRVVAGLEGCYKALNILAEDTSYVHWTGVELALAWYYKGKLSPKDFDKAYSEATTLLKRAIDYAERLQKQRYKNPHLLADALIFQSYFLRAHFRSKGRTAQRSDLDQDLIKAKEAAMKARDVAVSRGTAPLRSEAWAALGAAYTDMVEFRQKRGENFYEDFDAALTALKQALKENIGKNVRLDAACYLRLAKLCLLNPNTEILAYDYFAEWRELESKVEHAYLKEMARELRRKDKIGGPVLLVKASTALSREHWEPELFKFLVDVAVRRFVSNRESERHKRDEWEKLLRDYLVEHLEYSHDKITAEIKKRELVDMLMTMREMPSSTGEKPQPKSYPMPDFEQ